MMDLRQAHVRWLCLSRVRAERVGQLSYLAFFLLGLALTAAGVAAEVRHSAVVRQFERATGWPHGRPGYVVDHVYPLCAGGADAVNNLRWQAAEQAKRKDADERRLCAAIRAFKSKWAPHDATVIQP